jgi:hypothetical protein
VNDTLPLLDTLRSCHSDAQRAEWLFRCPLHLIGHAHLDIRAILLAAGLAAGVAYLEAELAGLAAVRTKDGELPFNIRFSINLARGDLKIAARHAGA